MKKLYRSRNEQIVAGVCGGLAEYFDMDPTIVRLLFLLLGLGPMPGILVYIVLAVIMPEAPLLDEQGAPRTHTDEQAVL